MKRPREDGEQPKSPSSQPSPFKKLQLDGKLLEGVKTLKTMLLQVTVGEGGNEGKEEFALSNEIKQQQQEGNGNIVELDQSNGGQEVTTGNGDDRGSGFGEPQESLFQHLFRYILISQILLLKQKTNMMKLQATAANAFV